jgi:hypothetical protein
VPCCAGPLWGSIGEIEYRFCEPVGPSGECEM